jgi:hypothetical protein
MSSTIHPTQRIVLGLRLRPLRSGMLPAKIKQHNHANPCLTLYVAYSAQELERDEREAWTAAGNRLTRALPGGGRQYLFDHIFQQSASNTEERIIRRMPPDTGRPPNTKFPIVPLPQVYRALAQAFCITCHAPAQHSFSGKPMTEVPCCMSDHKPTCADSDPARSMKRRCAWAGRLVSMVPALRHGTVMVTMVCPRLLLSFSNVERTYVLAHWSD